jgi:hypothetical protein
MMNDVEKARWVTRIREARELCGCRGCSGEDDHRPNKRTCLVATILIATAVENLRQGIKSLQETLQRGN